MIISKIKQSKRHVHISFHKKTRKQKDAHISRSKSFGPLFTNEICLWHHRLYLAGDSIFLCIALEWSYVCVCVHLSLYHVGTHECVHVFLWWHHFVFFLRQDLSLAWRSLSRWGCLGCEPQGFRTSPPSHHWDCKYILIYTGFCCPCHCLFSMDSGAHTPVLTHSKHFNSQAIFPFLSDHIIYRPCWNAFLICVHSCPCGLCLRRHVCGLACPCGHV